MNSNRRTGVAAVVALVAGLGLMIVPPVLRDGVCGLSSCADQVPVIAVTRASATELAVVVPEVAAPSVRTVELLEGGGRGSGSRQWLIRRDGDGAHTTFVFGAEPRGFATVVPLGTQPTDDVWTVQVGFRCTTASLPFSPSTLSVGELRSWSGVVEGNEFSASANTTERCATGRPGAEVALFFVGAVLAVIGAVLGIVVVLRRPVRFPEDPLDEDEALGGSSSTGTAPDDGADDDADEDSEPDGDGPDSA